MSSAHPTYGNGKICYIEMPAADINTSATFYKNVFDWHVRQRGDGATAFDDAVNEVSGAWVLNRKPMTEIGMLFYIMVDNIEATVDLIIANRGKIVQPVVKSPEIVAIFSDPAGNLIGVYQQPVKS